MIDSEFGLAAAILPRDEEAAVRTGNRVEAGTWLMNRCDYLVSALAWTGVKNPVRGCSLWSNGFAHLSRPGSLHSKRVWFSHLPRLGPSGTRLSIARRASVEIKLINKAAVKLAVTEANLSGAGRTLLGRGRSGFR